MQTGTTIAPPTMKHSAEDANVRIFRAAGWIQANNVEEITEQQLR